MTKQVLPSNRWSGRVLRRTREAEERAFVRGFVAAVAMTVRHETGATEMLRSINATGKMLKDAGVDDLEVVLPLVRRMQRKRAKL